MDEGSRLVSGFAGSSLEEYLFRSYIVNLTKNPLFKGSAIMIFGSLAGSFVNYITSILVGRHLGPAEYGVFTALISFLMILSVFNTSLNTTVVKFISSFKAEKDFNKVESLWKQLSVYLFFIGALVFVLLALLSPIIASFLRLDTTIPIIILGSVIWMSLVGAISHAVLNGLQEFFKLTLYQFLGVLVKLAVTVGLVYAGYKSSGALTGYALAYLVPLAFTIPFISKLSDNSFKKVKISLKEPLLYSLPVTLATLGLTMLFNLDVVLAKRFLTSTDAGLYGGLAVIGRVITFGTSPVALVMFPLISERVANNKPYKKILNFAILLTVLGGVGLSAIYFLFPRLVIDFFFGSAFYAASKYLGYFGLLLTLYSLCNLLTQFLLSVEKRKVWLLNLAGALIQAGGIFFFHASIKQILSVSLFSMSVLFVLLLILTTFSCGNRKKQPSA